MANALCFVQIGSCEEISPEEESKGEEKSEGSQDYDLLVGALGEINVGVDIVVVVVGKDGDQDKGQQKYNMLFRLVVNSESAPWNDAFFFHFVQFR